MNPDENQKQNQNTNPPPPPPLSHPDNQKLMGVLCYLGPLVIISYLTSKEDPFVKFHIKQGLIILIIEIIIWILGSMIWVFWPILSLINLFTFILSIIGIINVLQHKEKALPVVGHLADHFKF